ncbi:helix-turn-helix domain-containing protein [Companilactobacillus crustorum]|uniref:helix-turn-helix domain-containing protein n=1 Tax=Companilactobacillus crustorum TaxID=392416 RepID=UPI00237E2A4A|nr:helix-turn-helix transcriptional regulator [Companilactobacillus crustorum]WDT66070.1 helix-turn-helix domain-containing protein [Companilactobacillus crustorum]
MAKNINDIVLKTLSSNLNSLMINNNESMKDLSDSIGIAYTTVTDWSHGKTFPRQSSLKLLAKHFNVQVSDLMKENSCRNNSNEYRASNNTKIIEKLITTQITDDQLDSILSFIDFTTRNNTGNGDSKK